MGWSFDLPVSTVLVTCLALLGDLLVSAFPADETNVWSDWWSYDGISGPDYWGLLNSDWKLCTKGRYQSPINIQPESLVFDPSLSPLAIEQKEVKVLITNTGHDISIQITDGHHISISGGPLAYKYRIYEIKIHFGQDNSRGSEHRVSGSAFAAELRGANINPPRIQYKSDTVPPRMLRESVTEPTPILCRGSAEFVYVIQFMAFNEDLYSNITYAWNSPHGLTAIAVLCQVDTTASIETDVLFDAVNTVIYKGDEVAINNIVITNLLPETEFYMTYDGSLTYPPCHEVVTWIIMNRPLVIRPEQVDILRMLYQGDKSTHRSKMYDNFRSASPLKNRTIRTNIKSPDSEKEECVSRAETKYEVNRRFRH